MTHDSYVSALSGRYASDEMKHLWSDDYKFRSWRDMWIHLARAQQQLGLQITDDQITQMEAQVTNIDYVRIAALEKKKKHDVMAHVEGFGEVAPIARGIIHLGATSCDITDNVDLMQIKRSLNLLRLRLARVVTAALDFAFQHASLPILGLTHLQSAQPTTLGKRAAVWAYDLLLDLQALEELEENLPFRGIRGATGTQDSFLKLFDGDASKVKKLEELVMKACGFSRCVPVCGQTYTRKLDSRVVFTLADFGATASKIGNDIRLLQSRQEIEEPFEKDQVGSSAMAYKRNPMRCERVCALSRVLMGHVPTALQTHAVQWQERSLDDSAARRFFLPESFLLADAITLILRNVLEGLVVYPAVINRNLTAQLPFLTTEEILMAMVEAGADRQDCHERIRGHAQAASSRTKHEGADNDLLERIATDVYFAPVHSKLGDLLNPTRFVGRATEQVVEFTSLCEKTLEAYRDQRPERRELNV